MSCECSTILPIYNFPFLYQFDTYYGTGTITVLSALDVYIANLSGVEFNFEPTKINSKTLSGFQWSNPIDIQITSLSGWQFNIKERVMFEPVGLYEYLMTLIDSNGSRHTLMTGRLEIK